MLSVSPQTIMSSWEFRKSAIPCRSSGCSSKTTIRVFAGCFSGGGMYVRYASVGRFLPSQRRKCQAGNFARFIHRREHGRRRKLLSADSLGPDCADNTENLIRNAGTQESRKGISEIEGQAARVAASDSGSRASFNPLPHFFLI